jgi:hypothetical protein
MPSKSVGGRKSPGGFDSRPPPLRDSGCDQHGCTRRAREPGRGNQGSATGKARDPTPVFADFTSLGLLHHPPSWTSLPGADQRAGQVLMSGGGDGSVAGHPSGPPAKRSESPSGRPAGLEDGERADPRHVRDPSALIVANQHVCRSGPPVPGAWISPSFSRDATAPRRPVGGRTGRPGSSLLQRSPYCPPRDQRRVASTLRPAFCMSGVESLHRVVAPSPPLDAVPQEHRRPWGSSSMRTARARPGR